MKIAIIGMWHLGTIISSGLSSLNKNKKKPLVDCQKGLDSIILGLAAQESIQTGSPVFLEDFLN